MSEVNKIKEQPQQLEHNVMPRFFAYRHFCMINLEIEYNGKIWTSYSTPDHIRDKELIIKKAVSDGMLLFFKMWHNK